MEWKEHFRCNSRTSWNELVLARSFGQHEKEFKFYYIFHFIYDANGRLFPNDDDEGVYSPVYSEYTEGS